MNQDITPDQNIANFKLVNMECELKDNWDRDTHRVIQKMTGSKPDESYT